MSLLKWSKDEDVKRLLPMIDFMEVLMRFNPLNDLSGVQEVTGRVQRIRSKTVMLRNIDEL